METDNTVYIFGFPVKLVLDFYGEPLEVKEWVKDVRVLPGLNVDAILDAITEAELQRGS
jgi:hypothetical protein